MTRQWALGRVLDVVQALLAERGARSIEVSEQTSLVDDLGFDSFDFVDLTLNMERALGRQGFPMQEWADEQLAAPGPRFTIAALTDAYLEFISGSRGTGK